MSWGIMFQNMFNKIILTEAFLMKRFYRKHKKLCISSLTGVLFVSTVGCLLHFVYEWSGRQFLVGLVTPVSESTWEHMKLIYFPMLVFFLAEFYFLYRSYPHLLRADLGGILTGTLLIPVIFYTYTGIIGSHNLTLDILTFLVSALIGVFVRCRLLLSEQKKGYTFLYFICVLVLGACFLIFTYYPPDIGLFAAP